MTRIVFIVAARIGNQEDSSCSRYPTGCYDGSIHPEWYRRNGRRVGTSPFADARPVSLVVAPSVVAAL